MPTVARPTDRLSPVRREREMLSELEIAQCLLADESLRSVTIDPQQGRATLRYCDRRIDETPLARLAADLVDHGELSTLAAEPGRVECWTDSTTRRDSYVRAPQQATGWRRWMHLSLAGVWFTLAVLGAILPGLPCTGFLLLCSYSLCRSSKRLHQRLLDSKWFGPMLRHWQVHRGVRPGVKAKALGTLVLMVGLSLTLAPLPTAAWWAVAGAGAIGAGCIVRLRVVEA